MGARALGEPARRAELSLFVDSSAFYAAADHGDRHHRRALEILDGESLVTTDHVLVESWLLMHRRGSRHAADRFWGWLRGAATIEHVGVPDLDVAWEIGETFQDQDFSIVDRTSFAVMRRLGVTRVASFDDHFAIYRYGARLERAFEIVR